MATASKKDYAAIAKSKITTPSVMSERPPRLLIYGRNKKGKTRFCTTAPDVLIADPEFGTSRMTRINPNVWPIEKWEDMDDLYRYLKLGDHPYKWIALDPVTRIHAMALRFVRNLAEERSLDSRPQLVHKQHYGQAGELTKDMLWNFHNLPMGVIFTAQERQQTVDFSEEGDDDVEESAMEFVPDLPKGARAAVNSIVDVIGRIYTVKTEAKVKVGGKVVDKEVIQRRLWLEPHPSYDTGYRSDFTLPAYLKNPTVTKLVELMMSGKVSNNG